MMKNILRNGAKTRRDQTKPRDARIALPAPKQDCTVAGGNAYRSQEATPNDTMRRGWVDPDVPLFLRTME